MLGDLETLSWMDEPTRARAVQKVHKIANMIGYPDRWRSYDGLEIDRHRSLERDACDPARDGAAARFDREAGRQGASGG